MAKTYDEATSRNTSEKSFEEYVRKVIRPQGRPKTTLMQIIRQGLSKIRINLDLSSATKTLRKRLELTQSRSNWSSTVKCVVQ